MRPSGISQEQKSRALMASLAHRAYKAAACLEAPNLQKLEVEPGGLYLHRGTAAYDFEWAVLERDDQEAAHVYVVPTDPLSLSGSWDLSVDPKAACGALTLRCALGAWVPAREFRPELYTGSLPPGALARARELSRRARRAGPENLLAEEGEHLLTPDEDLATYREQLRHAIAALNLLESMSNSKPSSSLQLKEELEITTLYEAIARRTAILDPSKAAEDPELSATWASLRELQLQEAARYQDAFEASLAMPLDAGKTILERARTQRKRFENSASDLPTSA